MTPAVARAQHHGPMSARPPLALGMSRQPGERWSGFAERVAQAFGLVLLLVILTYVLASVTPYRGWTAVLIVAVAAASTSVGLVSAEARPCVVRWGAYLAATSVVLAIVNAAFGSSIALAISALIQMLLFLV